MFAEVTLSGVEWAAQEELEWIFRLFGVGTQKMIFVCGALANNLF
jgi:hypothetical protein